MSTYLKHMGGYKHKQLMGKSYDEIQKLFDKEMKRVNIFVAMSSEAQESNEKKVEGSEEKAKSSRKKSPGKKRALKEHQQESPKRKKLGDDKETDEYEEVEAYDIAELKKLLVIKKDDDIAINVIPLATKPPMIVDYKLLKEGIMVHYQLISADGSSKRHYLMIRLLQAVSIRPRAKGLVIHEEEQATTPTVSSQQPSQVKAQDKGKGIMVEEPVKMKKKDQINLDEDLAFKLQAKEEEERLVREKAQKKEEANIVSWDNVQAMIDADYQMAQQMQEEEQEKLSIEEKSKLFVQLLEARKKHFVAMRAQEMRNKPPTKAQKRNTMSTYLKNMAGYKHNQLKNKSFDDIQNETRVEGSSKKAGEELEQESSKKQKLDEDKETAELQRLIKVVSDKEGVEIDAIPLATKPPSIVDYTIHKEEKKTYY
ncbi:hypothetical protein Tco_0772923 [Tanacetum coccineum]|uniref:Uncharacterized protein n=1 Tax=Tanacetum coccineum TaxID=301880 RepID=A0ABQ4ZKA7_9ASTR